jgi:hypothetical protein
MDLGPNCKVTLWPQDLPKRHLQHGHLAPDYVTTKPAAQDLSTTKLVDRHFCALRWPAPRGYSPVIAYHIPRRSASTSPTNAWAKCSPTAPRSGPAWMLDDAMGGPGDGTTAVSIGTLRPARPGGTPVNWTRPAPCLMTRPSDSMDRGRFAVRYVEKGSTIDTAVRTKSSTWRVTAE